MERERQTDRESKIDVTTGEKINSEAKLKQTDRQTRGGMESKPGARSPHFMPCWKTEFLLVLQMIRSAHCTTTMLTKKAVWHVNSTTFLCS